MAEDPGESSGTEQSQRIDNVRTASGRVGLTRAVRFAVDLSTRQSPQAGAAAESRRHNSFAGLPSMQGLGLHCEMVVNVAGEPDRQTGYLMNISAIDTAVREAIVPLLARHIGERTAPLNAEALLRECWAALRPHLDGHLRSLRWNLTPYYSITMNAELDDRVLMRQSFEFAAAHRLHCDDLDADSNRRIFGKCNNPSGHGHNYRLEVCVECPLDGRGLADFNLQALEAIVDDVVIKRFDHKHLNRDTTEFATVNPSVENIARACHRLLQHPIADAGGRIRQVTVWETEKTSCTYPAYD